jgi:hypothetical protein
MKNKAVALSHNFVDVFRFIAPVGPFGFISSPPRGILNDLVIFLYNPNDVSHLMVYT